MEIIDQIMTQLGSATAARKKRERGRGLAGLRARKEPRIAQSQSKTDQGTAMTVDARIDSVSNAIRAIECVHLEAETNLQGDSVPHHFEAPVAAVAPPPAVVAKSTEELDALMQQISKLKEQMTMFAMLNSGATSSDVGQ